MINLENLKKLDKLVTSLKPFSNIDTIQIDVRSGENRKEKYLTINPKGRVPSLELDNGTITFDNVDLAPLSPDERSNLGLFLAFQYPVELPGVSSTNFLREIHNSRKKHLGEDELSHLDFVKLLIVLNFCNF